MESACSLPRSPLSARVILVQGPGLGRSPAWQNKLADCSRKSGRANCMKRIHPCCACRAIPARAITAHAGWAVPAHAGGWPPHRSAEPRRRALQGQPVLRQRAGADA
eukprot:scaffold92616_cov21-Tisochrysis_lutea.AAC.1